MRQQEQGSAADGWDPVKANGVIARPANRARPSKVLINIMILQSDSFKEKNKDQQGELFQPDREGCLSLLVSQRLGHRLPADGAKALCPRSQVAVGRAGRQGQTVTAGGRLDSKFR